MKTLFPPVFLLSLAGGRRRLSLGALLLAGAAANPARADVTLAPLFVDHAVFQRDQELPVWGRADPGEHVTVTFKGETMGTTTGADGHWVVYLPAVPASIESAVLTVSGKNTVTVSDVLVGEVWLVSGQSNMEWVVAKSNDSEREIATANYPLIRHIKVAHTIADQPAETVTTSGWQTAQAPQVGQFSAIGYFFARDLHRKLGVPIGIVNSSYGGTQIESWMDGVALRKAAAWPAVNAVWLKGLAEFPQTSVKYAAEREAWEKADAAARQIKKRNLQPRPIPPVGPGTVYALSGLYNGMIVPLQPYAIRGFLWYQGEANWTRPGEYASLFPELIRGWRRAWGQGDLPFYFVQLASYAMEDPTQRGWAKLREAQLQGLLLPATDMVTAIDIGDPKDIHPRNKQEVGRRLASIAKSRLYGIPGDVSGPVFEKAEREGAAMRVHFSHVATSLISYDRPVQSLEIAGADKVFHPATARIDRNTLVIQSPAVKEPVAVRYAWSNAPVANLYNGAGLPALPFRSDSW